MKIHLKIELDYDADLMHGNDPDALVWFFDEIMAGELLLHSNELGDTVGSVKILKWEKG